MSKPNMEQVGNGRAYQNPQDAIEAMTGKYHDAAADGGLEEKLATQSFPKVACSSTFSIKSRAGGGR